MSYILSALRKAEQDRRQGQPASGGLAGLVAEGPEVAPSSPWPLVLVVVVLAVLIAAGVWLWPGTGGGRGEVVDRPPPAVEDSPPRSSPPATLFVAPPVAPPAPPPVSALATPAAPVAAASESPRPQWVESRSAEPQPVEPQPVEPMPSLNITGYIYFEDAPERSKLFVDGVVYRHQSRLREGMTLEAFFPDAVLVSYRGREHRVAVP